MLRFIKELAGYERLSHEVVATEEDLRNSLFGEFRVAEALLAYLGDEPAGFALFFHNFSTFLGKPGLYLEDLYVSPEFRGSGIGKSLLVRLAKVGRGAGLRASRMVGSELERPGDRVLQEYRGQADGRLDGLPGYRG